MKGQQMQKTEETYEERQARVSREAAELRHEAEQRAREHAQQQAEQQHQADMDALARWDPRALDAAVQSAKSDLTQILEADPLVLALARHIATQTRRRMAWGEHVGTLARQGRPTQGAQLPPPADRVDIAELVSSAAERLAAEIVSDHNK